ncbi:MAG: bifunctional glutamate N-acetyltransferase/amino-acid acetyltransferase ArgJ [Planctomycetes bacterium]|nr:bifunctional glutamate N-acetyltransferase/amino-acid acetyltransferase ArgJ [Planctomycetota bacterium]
MIEPINGGVTASAGFKAAGVHCGVKSDGESPDLAVLYSEYPTHAAAMFTTNQMKAAPVQWSIKRIRENDLRAVVVNSGNANACTGPRGLADVERTARVAAEHLGVGTNQVFVASTGSIGVPLPIDKIESGIGPAIAALSSSEEAGGMFARAIMTTDTVAKSVAFRFEAGGAQVHLGGSTKGAGMIAPKMATMLCFLTTDAAISPQALDKALHDAVEQSFNRITVDGHTSTNDTTVVLANGAAGNETIEEGTCAYAAFCEVLDLACLALAKMMVRDAEGATKLVRVEVTGAQEREHATMAARAIANSPLVKTAVHGGDPNWGRVISAAGYSGAPVDPAKVKLWMGNVLAFADGAPATLSRNEMAVQMQGDEVCFRLDLGQGDESDTYWTSDLSKEYVTINADYST